VTTTESATEATVLPPQPDPSPLTQFFWDGVAEHKLMILRCQSCGKFIHWPREVCRFCLSTNLAPEQVSGRGVLATYTIPMQPMDPFFLAKVPYVLAVIELDEQKNLKLVSNIVGCELDDVVIGMPVEVSFEEVAPGVTLPLFKPASAASTPAQG
jgi:uncharacterized OB-fold protein